MGTLRLMLALGGLLFAVPATAQTVTQWRQFINEASSRFSVAPTWIERVMQAESRGRTHLAGRPIRSSAGAMGLMQLMPGTWLELRARLGLGDDPDDPRDNILAGTFYLRLMYDRFGYPGLFAAYNAGPGRYVEHLSGRRPLPTETVGYMASVASSAPISTGIAARPRPPLSIFVVRKDGGAAQSDGEAAPPSSPLFIALSQEK